MEWFRSIHGAPTHRKWLSVARKSGQPVPLVVSVVWALMDHASRQQDRGSVASFDHEDLAAYLNVEDEAVEAVISTLTDKAWLVDDRIASWEEHQVKRAADLRPSAHVWAMLRSFVFERDDFTCQYCGARGVKLECDHVIPVSRGGSNQIENLKTACFSCNRSKRAKTLDEWRGADGPHPHR